MPLTFKDRVKQAVSAGGTGAITVGAASSGYQALGAGDNALLFPYVIEDGTAWETGYGTYTHSGTSWARTYRSASSTGAALNVTTAAFLFVDAIAELVQNNSIAAQSPIPGGRLTLTTGVPVTTADVTGATTIYYAPYTSNVIVLWDGNVWKPVVFAQTSLALGTLTNARPYDVFGYLSSGVLATELLVWTSDTARATAITIQDGRYCKSGDKTRLYLGSFRTTATTTTEDSCGGTTTQVGGKRFLFNMYNRVARRLAVFDSTVSWSYTTGTIRQSNAAVGNKVELLIGVSEDLVRADIIQNIYLQTNSARGATIGVGLDSTSTFSGFQGSQLNLSSNIFNNPTTAPYSDVLAVGYHYFSWNERGADGTCSFIGANSGTAAQAGMTGLMWA